MLIRIVRMHFKEGNEKEFLKIFDLHKISIGNFSGCTHLQLLIDLNDPLCYTTLSYWRAEENLEDYRQSELFAAVWKKVKPLFSKKTEAFSFEEVETIIR